MNVTALLDTPLRSSAPLDPSVGDDTPDPAFANVMSQYQSNGNKSLAPGTQSETAEATNGAPTGAATTEDAAASPDSTDNATLTLVGLIDPNGDALPLDGQPLPPTDDATDDTLDATDASAAASMIVALPLPPAPPATTTTLAAVAVATPDSTADAPVVPQPTAPAAAQAVDPTTADADAPVQLPPVDPRTIKKDGDAAAIAQSAAAPVTDDSAQRSGSVAHALRGLGLGHRQAAPDGNAMPHPGAGRQRDPNGSSGENAPKIANAHLAAALEAAGQKDSALLQKDGATDSIRTDAVLPRANGSADVSRDTAATRLNDLAQQHAPRFAAELADRVLVLRSQRFDSATVSLEPRELGRIDIQVRLQADTTHVAFTAQHAGVRDALEGQMPRLRAMLEEAGLSLGNVDVAHSGSRGAGDSGTARSYAGSQPVSAVDAEVADASPRWQRRAELSIIDLHA